MSEARLHALHWAFFVDVMDMEFADLHAMFSAWCQSVPADEMTDIMALGDALFGDDADAAQPDNLYTEEEIWNDTSSNADFSLN